MAFTPQHLFFDDIAVGQEWESLGRTITEADIVLFAGLSGDFNPMHVDHEFARTTAFRQPIAHGLLIWAVSSGLSLYAPPMRTLAFLAVRDWSFVGPVFIGDTIRIRSRVLELKLRARGRRGLVTWQREICKQGGETVQRGVTVTLVEGRASVGPPAMTPAVESAQEP